MRNPSRFPLIAGLLASLVTLALAVQLGLLLFGVTAVAGLWPSPDLDRSRTQPAAAGESVRSAARPALPRAAAGAGPAARPRGTRAHFRERAAARGDPRPEFPRASVDAEAPPSGEQRPPVPDGPRTSSLFFLGLGAPEAGPSVTITGLDLAAPRDLVLWQVNEEPQRAAPLARTSSRADGLFELARLLLPTRGVRLVLTVEGGDPFDAASAAVLDLAALAPPSPRAWIDRAPAGQAAGRAELRVVPDSRAYDLSLGDAAGREFARLSIPGVLPAATDSRLGSKPLRFALDQIPLRIARNRFDGSRSEWSALPTRHVAGPRPRLEEAR